MTLMMTETGELTVSSFELHDDYRFPRDATLLLQWAHHISTEDSEPVNDSSDNNANDNHPPIGPELRDLLVARQDAPPTSVTKSISSSSTDPPLALVARDLLVARTPAQQHNSTALHSFWNQGEAS